MWLAINNLLFGAQRLKWVLLLSSAAVTGLVVSALPLTELRRFSVLILLVPAISGVIAVFTYARVKGRQISALDILEREHSDLQESMKRLVTAQTAGHQTAAVESFMTIFDRHHESEERTFFFEVGAAFPSRLSPQFEVFSGHHGPIDMAARQLRHVIGTPEFLSAAHALEVAVENHIREEELIFPEILRVAGHEFLGRVGTHMV